MKSLTMACRTFVLLPRYSRAKRRPGGRTFDQNAARTALADNIIMLASEDETDSKILKQLALTPLPPTLEA